MRPAEGNAWDLPEWNHPFTAGVYPFGVRTDDRAILLGTAFCISKVRLVMSAYHVVYEALTYHPNCDALRRERWLSERTDLSPLSFDVLHRHENRFTLWPLRTMVGARPTDIVFAHPTVTGRFPYLALPLSFAIPRVGSRVSAVGYGGLRTGRGGLETQRLIEGDLTELEAAGLTIKVREGRVKRVFTKRFAAGYIEGPCFEIDCEVEHGMSGGPVFNEDGFVCGVIAAGAGIYSESGGTVVSLLYPLVTLGVPLEIELAPNFIMKSEMPLIELVTNGSIQTDGSEETLPLSQTDDGTMVGVPVNKDDVGHLFDDLHGALAGIRAEAMTGDLHHFRRLRPDER